MSSPSRLVVVDVDELRALVRDALVDALEGHEGKPAAPTLLDRAGLALALDISTRSLDRLRREGMPELRVGDVPRWRLDAVLAWLAARPSARSAGALDSEASDNASESAADGALSGNGLLPTTRNPAKTRSRSVA